MRRFDIKKKIIKPSSAEHSQHEKYLALSRARAEKHFLVRNAWSAAFLFVFSVTAFGVLISESQAAGSTAYQLQSSFQQVRAAYLARQFQPLPVLKHDPKVDVLMQYLSEKKSPLVNYVGTLSRMENWKLILGIAHAESNLCKKTDRNNCWGIGPGSPFYYDDISESLYYVNYLIDKYHEMGMQNPETMVRRYVGRYSSNWVTAVNDVAYELAERGLQ
ncbi:MAG: hypothetical protein AAB871_00430 [Patescibacteria group bacterium]